MNSHHSQSVRAKGRQLFGRAGFVLACLLGLGVTQASFAQPNSPIRTVVIENLEPYYYTQDPHYANVSSRLPELENALDQLRSELTAVQRGRAEELGHLFSESSNAIDVALRRTRSAIQLNNELVAQYGNVEALFPSSAVRDENRLAKVTMRLRELLRELGDDSAVAVAFRRFDQLRRSLEDEFEQIDEGAARRKTRSAAQKIVIEDASAAPVAATPCENVNLEEAGFKIRNVRIQDPFKFLPWVKRKEDNALRRLAPLKNKNFTYAEAVAGALDIIEQENFLPETTDRRVQFRIEVVRVENCANGQLDLVYGIFSSQIMPVLSAAPERRVTERQLPQTAAGQTTVIAPANKWVNFIPLGGYDSKDLFSAGGRLEIVPPRLRGYPLESAVIEGLGSQNMHYVSAALQGSVDTSVDGTHASKWLAHGEWSLKFVNYSLPTGAGPIKSGYLSAQFSGTSKPLGNGDFTFRFGGLIEAGNKLSDIRGVTITPETIPNSGYGTAKFYLGLNSRLRHNVLSASYGLELGANGPAARVDWRKHIFDAKHEFWYPLGDHRLLDLESQFTLGSIQVPGRIPLAARFFGGNNEETFIRDDDWRIRVNPVIRAIPGNKFFRNADGAGSKSFLSYNLTAAYAVWRKALIPRELTADPEFKAQLDGVITTVTSTLQNYYASKDSSYAKVVGRLASIQAEIVNLKTSVTNAEAAHGNDFPDQFKACSKAIRDNLRRLSSAINPTGVDQYGLIDSILSNDPDEIQLLKIKQKCGIELNGVLNDSQVATGVSNVDGIRIGMLSDFTAIDQAAAANKAKSDMAFTRRTLQTLFNDVNIYAISPVFVFDIARLSPSRNGLGGVRYGPGGGLRFELASVAQFTAGYAWNVKQGIGEGRGNFFFSIGIRDLFNWR